MKLGLFALSLATTIIAGQAFAQTTGNDGARSCSAQSPCHPSPQDEARLPYVSGASSDPVVVTVPEKGQLPKGVIAEEPTRMGAIEPVDSLNIGDQVIFVTHGTTNGMPSSNDNCRVTITVSEFNSTTLTYTIRSDIICPNGSDVKYDYLKREDAGTPRHIEDVMTNCTTKYKGRLEKVTVPAGTFDSCVAPFNDGNSSGVRWMGRVPMANIKAVGSAGASNMTLELEAYSYGK